MVLVYSAANAALGRCFEKYMKGIGQNSRGVKYRPDLAVLRLTKCEAILNEIAFIDNKKDISDWDEPAEMKAAGEALAKAAAEWLNLDKKGTEKTYKALLGMNIRSKPDLEKGVVIGYLKQGDTITGTPAKEDASWLDTPKGYVRIKGVSTTYLKEV